MNHKNPELSAEEIGTHFLKYFNALEIERQPLDQHWRDSYRYTLPHRGQNFFNNNLNNPISKAETARRDKVQIYDSTAINGVKLVASSMVSGLTPASSQWFNLMVKNKDKDDMDPLLSEWLQKSSRTLHKLIHGGNYDNQALEFFLDEAIAGMAAMYIDMNKDDDLRFEVLTPGSYYVADTLGNGRVDTLVRILNLTKTQAIEKFGIHDTPEMILEGHNENKTYTFVHIIKPRMKNGKQMKGIFKKAMPWQSVYIFKNTKELVMEEGYRTQPFIVPRWSLIPGTQYAIGLMNDVLPDVLTLNKVVEMQLTTAEENISNTHIAKPDGIHNASSFRLKPRFVNYLGDPASFRTLPPPGNFSISLAEIERLQTSIETGLMVDKLSPTAKNYATASEVNTRQQILRQILGPTFTRMSSEYLETFIERCLDLTLKAGLLGEVPDSIADEVYIPVYQSPLVRAMKSEDVFSMDKFEASLANQAQFKPAVLDLYDFDKAVRLRAELLGVPIELLNTPQDVKLKRDQQAEAQAQQQAQQQQAEAEQQQGQAPDDGLLQ